MISTMKVIVAVPLKRPPISRVSGDSDVLLKSDPHMTMNRSLLLLLLPKKPCRRTFPYLKLSSATSLEEKESK